MGNETHVLRGLGKDKIGGEVDYDYDIIKLSLIMEANYWKH
jgi:hypothetical protein